MRPVIAGNWKMNHGPNQARAFFDTLEEELGGLRPRMLVFPPALSLAAAFDAKPDFLELGVQNVYHEPSGAFTGELSVEMAKEAGATHVLVGHSERRHVFGETDDDVGRKTRAVLEAGLTPVVCVGETIEERRAGRVEEVISRQIDAVVEVFAAHPDAEVMVAYEPVWAIGTGETATPSDATAAHTTLRGRLASALGAQRAADIPILYGGSVKPVNAAELLGANEVDGVLVGGASLDPTSFAQIARAAG